MSAVLTLLRKDLRLFARDRTALALTFLVPLVLIYIFGQVFGVGRSGGAGPSGIALAVVSQTDAPVAAAITAALRQEKAFRVLTTETAEDGTETPLTEERVRAMIHDNRLRFALVFPPDAQGDDTFGLKLRFLNNPRNDIETQTVTGILQKVIFTSAPQALFDSLRKRAVAVVGEPRTEEFYRGMARNVASTFGGDADAIYEQMKQGLPSGDALAGETATATATAAAADAGATDPAAATQDANSADAFLSQIVKIESEQLAGQQVTNPGATRSVGGWAMMFLLFAVTGSASSLFEEKKAGLFQRILAAPVRRAHILWSKYLFNMLLGLVQLGVMFAAGRVLFGIDVTSNLPNLFLVCLAASAACTAFGMLLASVSSSPAAASGLGTFLILTMSAIGGAWFPTSFMPEFIQQLAKLTIVYWSIEGFMQVLWAGQGLREILPTLGVLLGIAAAVNVVTIWRFRRGTMFE